MLYPDSYCPKSDEEWHRIMKGTEYTNFEKKYADLYPFFTEKAKFSVKDLQTLGNLYDTFLVNKQNGYDLPIWVTDDLMKRLLEIKSFLFYIPYSTKLQQSLRAGKHVIVRQMGHS